MISIILESLLGIEFMLRCPIIIFLGVFTLIELKLVTSFKALYITSIELCLS